jgi:serine/threonine protein phosphatase PrpC
LAKKLRLAVAELTDVGRRRERNQDNVAHSIPTDEDTLQRRGAIFVVCDGMGGHAAGEVASQLAIDTLREAYYNAHENTIVGALAHAVDRANQTIFGHAREHPELTGMGTTCVAAVVAGGRAYIVNIGDSRAYIVRHGKMRQVTQDHSWVAEQVRVGLLTEEQARTHSHRNVITRSLGTQPSVTADLFIETMRDDDRMLLCSDGLHGYVDEREIEREVATQDEPERGVHDLIAMANANGGPDNITALIVHLLEVPEVVGELQLPTTIAPAAEGVLTEEGTTAPLPIVTRKPDRAEVPAAARAATSQPAAVAPRVRSPVRTPARAARKKRSTAARVTIGLLEVAALLALAAGIWYYFFGPFAAGQAQDQRIRTDLTHAQQTISGVPSEDPTTALIALSKDRQQLLNDLNNPGTDAQSRQQIQTTLVSLEAAVQSALKSYNLNALIRPVPSSSVVAYSGTPCTAPGATSPAPLTKVTQLATVTAPPPSAGKTAPATRYVYILSAGVVYEVIAPIDGSSQGAVSGSLACVAIAPSSLVPPDVTSTASIASEGSTLYMLAQQGSGSYSVLALTPDGFNPDNSLHFQPVATRFAVPTPGGEKPTELAGQNGTYYVSYEQNSGADGGLWVFSGDTSKGPSKQLTLPRTVTALILSSGVLYLSLTGGGLGQVDSTPAYHGIVVTAPPPLQPLDGNGYTVATPVPTPAASSSDGARFTGEVSLGVDPANPTHLLVDDGALSRVVRLTTSGSGGNPSLASQYAYAPALQAATPLTTVSANGRLWLYVWAQDHLAAFPAPDA